METMNMDYAPAKIAIFDKAGMEKGEIRSDAIKHISIITGCYDGNVVGVGSVYSPQCTIVMDEAEEITIGTPIGIYFGINGIWELKGIFFTNGEPECEGGGMTVTAHGMIGQYGNVVFDYDDFYLLNRKTTIRDVLIYLQTIREIPFSFVVNNPSPNFGDWEITAPLRKRGEEGTESENRITINELLAGIAVMYGGNIVERDGSIYLTSQFDRAGIAEFDLGDCNSGFNYSKKKYGIRFLKASFLPTVVNRTVDDPEHPTEVIREYLVYSGTGRASRAIYFIPSSENDADIQYDQVIECDWIGNGMGFSGNIFLSGKVSYHTGNFEFSGYNKELRAGEKIRIKTQDEDDIIFIVGEMTLNWDGGFTIAVSCNCGVDACTGTFHSSTSSSATSAQNATSAMIQYNNSVYADTLLANVAEISQAFVGKLTANEAFIEDLQAKTVTAEVIKAATAEVGYLTAEEADLKYAEIDLANIKDGCITNAKIQNATIAFEKVGKSFIGDLTANAAFIQSLRAYVASFGYLDAEKADLKYADITFGNIDTANINVAEVAKLFTKVGLIDRATISEGHITGFLDAVEVNANKITAGTLIADRLLLRGSRNGLLYQLNNLGELTSQNINTLDGTVLTKRTISADKLIAKSITANEIDVTNLFAQNITASGTITGATLYGAYAEITNGRVGIFDITQYALTFDNGTNKSTLDRAGLTVGLSYGNTVASGNYTTYGATGIKCRYSTLGDYVFSIDTGTSGAVELTGSLVPAAGGASRIGAELTPFETAYIKTVKTNSGNLTLQAGGNVVIGQQSLYLNDGKYNRAVLTTFDDGDTANYGAELCVGTGGNTFVGSGESATLLRSDFQKSVKAGETYGRTGERLYLSSDETVYIYSNCNQIGSRKGIAYDYAGHLRPLLGQNSDLGTSVCPWNSAVIKEIHVSKFGLTTGALGASNCTLEESYLFRIGNIVFLHVVFNSAYATSGWTRFINIPDGFRPKSLQHDNVITNSGEAAITQINPGGFLQVNWYPGFGGIRFTTCYVSS